MWQSFKESSHLAAEDFWQRLINFARLFSGLLWRCSLLVLSFWAQWLLWMYLFCSVSTRPFLNLTCLLISVPSAFCNWPSLKCLCAWISSVYHVCTSLCTTFLWLFCQVNHNLLSFLPAEVWQNSVGSELCSRHSAELLCLLEDLVQLSLGCLPWFGVLVWFPLYFRLAFLGQVNRDLTQYT